MFFNQGFIDGCFDVNAIQNFYNLLSEKLDNTSIDWREKRTSVDDSILADNVIISYNGSSIFKMNTQKQRGFINLSNIEGIEDIYYNSLVDSGLMYTDNKPSYITPILASIGHFLLLALVTNTNPEMASFIWYSFAFLMGSIILSSIILRANLGSAMRIVSSTISLLGFIALAPSSLLQIPLVTAINRSHVYAQIKKVYRGEVQL